MRGENPKVTPTVLNRGSEPEEHMRKWDRQDQHRRLLGSETCGNWVVYGVKEGGPTAERCSPHHTPAVFNSPYTVPHLSRKTLLPRSEAEAEQTFVRTAGPGPPHSVEKTVSTLETLKSPLKTFSQELTNHSQLTLCFHVQISPVPSKESLQHWTVLHGSEKVTGSINDGTRHSRRAV